MYKLLQELNEKATKEPDGTYVGAKLSADTKNMLDGINKKLEIPNPLEKKDMHITIVYSRKYVPEFKSRGKLDEPIIAKPDELTIFPSSEGNNVLVLKLKTPDLIERHEEIVKEYGATHDFDEYKPHVTLSYDVGEFDPSDVDINDFGDIEVTEEYDEELNLDWLNSAKNK